MSDLFNVGDEVLLRASQPGDAVIGKVIELSAGRSQAYVEWGRKRGWIAAGKLMPYDPNVLDTTEKITYVVETDEAEMAGESRQWGIRFEYDDEESARHDFDQRVRDMFDPENPFGQAVHIVRLVTAVQRELVAIRSAPKTGRETFVIQTRVATDRWRDAITHETLEDASQEAVRLDSSGDYTGVRVIKRTEEVVIS